MREKLQDCQKSQVFYEWDFEVSDEHGDIVDHEHYDKLPKTSSEIKMEENVELVLIRESGNEADGLQDRQWAYPEIQNGILCLPEEFDGGNKIPRRFREELAKWQGWTLANTA